MYKVLTPITEIYQFVKYRLLSFFIWTTATLEGRDMNREAAGGSMIYS